MDGRVKTLHPNIHGGLLAVRDNEMHVAQMNEIILSQLTLLLLTYTHLKKQSLSLM